MTMADPLDADLADRSDAFGIDHDEAAIAGLDAMPTGLVSIARSRLMELAEDGKSELVRGFDNLVTLANELAAQVDSAGGGAIASYAWQAAGLLGDIQSGLRDKPVEDLLEDGRTIIREQPALAVGVAVVAGFLVARLVKSSRR
ncbi:MAG: hypothetical protein ACOYLS_07390 [Polymorphobacter sp.]